MKKKVKKYSKLCNKMTKYVEIFEEFLKTRVSLTLPYWLIVSLSCESQLNKAKYIMSKHFCAFSVKDFKF